MREKLSKLVNVYKKYGILGFVKKVLSYISANWLSRYNPMPLLRRNSLRRSIREMLSGEYDRIILWRSGFGYNVPLFQRPQHIARSLAKQGCLVLYEVTTMTDDVKTITKHEDNLYLVNLSNVFFRNLLMEELDKVTKPKYLQLYSTDWSLSMADVQSYLDRGFRFIYEYIDHISPALSGTSMLPKAISDKYDYAMTHADTFVVVTADLLREDVIQRRGTTNMAFSTNGVDYAHFQSYKDGFVFDADFQKVLRIGKPIVCYYGALAKWFDYELVRKIAATDKYSVVLFDMKYDESFDEQLKGVKNVYFLGPRNYDVLKYYARACDVLTIPFLVNDITRATSPVKVFEYMAMHKPVVTTDMNECRKYGSVLIGKTHEEFIALLDKAMTLRSDSDYLAQLDRDARSNDWSMKAKAIID
ncbi:MAG: glycosyltransferase, partial [Oscillospiraceae bacterium]|nr:glycosyltransferase [Oscillospiraceae bacterium]